MTRLKQFLASPLLHCLLLGAVLAGVLAAREPLPLIEVSDEQLQESIEQWWKQFGSQPGEREKSVMLERLIDDEVLYQEARKAGFDALPIVERRLLQLTEFLQLRGDDSPEQALDTARQLGLDQSDPMVRRYMVNSLREVLASRADVAAITEQDIKAIYEANPAHYTRPARRALVHVYIGGMGDAAKRKAMALGEELKPELSADQAIALGDAFYGGHKLAISNRRQLANRMGYSFAESVFELPTTGWQGPISSAYGLHWVKITEAEAAELRPLAEVREQIASTLLTERQRESTEQAVRDLRKGYRIATPSSVPAEVDNG